MGSMCRLGSRPVGRLVQLSCRTIATPQLRHMSTKPEDLAAINTRITETLGQLEKMRAEKQVPRSIESHAHLVTTRACIHMPESMNAGSGDSLAGVETRAGRWRAHWDDQYRRRRKFRFSTEISADRSTDNGTVDGMISFVPGRH